MTTLALPTSTAALRHALRTNRQRTLTRIYQQTFPMVRRLVRQHGGSVQDAQDVFHDALIVFYEKALADTLVLTASVSTYLVGVSRHLWQRELRRRKRLPLAELADDAQELLISEALAAEEATASVLDYVAQLGTRCRELLLAFYYFQQPLEQIAADHQYRNVRSATVQKFKCLERLRNAVRSVLVETFTT